MHKRKNNKKINYLPTRYPSDCAVLPLGQHFLDRHLKFAKHCCNLHHHFTQPALITLTQLVMGIILLIPVKKK